MSKKNNTQQRDYFWCGNTLMSNNNNGTFSSSHIMEINESVIKLKEFDRNLIVAAPELLEACKKAMTALRAITGYGPLAKKSEEIAMLCEKALIKADGNQKPPGPQTDVTC